MNEYHITSRKRTFTLLLVVCLVVAIAYVGWAMLRGSSGTTNTIDAHSSIVQEPVEAGDLAASGSALLFRNTTLGEHFGVVAFAPYEHPDETRRVTGLYCERIHFAAGRGICLIANRGVFTTYSAVIFDDQFQPQHTFSLAGIPSRARVSPDGRLAAFTVFVSGHSYAADNFSTQTTLVEMRSGAVIVEDLEQFKVWKDQQRFQAIDFNFWGVTFTTDSNRFYATLASGGQTYLIEGEVATRQAHVLVEQVECPSLSPDNTRIAYKKLTRDRGWQLHILDLATMVTSPLSAELRSVDDQVEWLDDNHVLYVLADDSGFITPGENIWVAAVDGSEAPSIFIQSAASPTVIH